MFDPIDSYYQLLMFDPIAFPTLRPIFEVGNGTALAHKLLSGIMSVVGHFLSILIVASIAFVGQGSASAQTKTDEQSRFLELKAKAEKGDADA